MVSSVGLTGVMVNWDQRQSNASSRHTQFQYTIDGITFVDALQGLFSGTPGDTWFNMRAVDPCSVAAVANNASFGVRLVASFAPGSGSYVAASPTGTYGAAGTNRFDMVAISAVHYPRAADLRPDAGRSGCRGLCGRPPQRTAKGGAGQAASFCFHRTGPCHFAIHTLLRPSSWHAC